MNWGMVAAIGSPVLVFLIGVLGLLFKRSTDRADREAAAAKEKADREATERQADRDQLQEDLKNARDEIRALQGDIATARQTMNQQQLEMQQLWSDHNSVRRELDAATSHIADVHRWDDGGRRGPMPTWKAA